VTCQIFLSQKAHRDLNASSDKSPTRFSPIVLASQTIPSRAENGLRSCKGLKKLCAG
jgi:hypothetical protein